MALEVLACAKVNLGWHVGALREDGFHDVRGAIQTVSLQDRLAVRVHDDPDDVSGDIVCDVAGVPVGLTVDGDEGSADLASRGNLVIRASERLAEELAPAPTSIRLTKSVPVGAGLGGGSADAAAALVGIAIAWSAELTRARLPALAAELGSDVPAILSGGLVHVSGRGELVRSIGCATGTGFVLGVGSVRLATPEVYRRLDELRARGDAAPDSGGLENDLEPAAVSLAPAIAEGLRAMREAGSAAAFISGSGPTVVGVVSGLADARVVAARLDGAFRRVVVCEASKWGVRVRVRRPDRDPEDTALR